MTATNSFNVEFDVFRCGKCKRYYYVESSVDHLCPTCSKSDLFRKNEYIKEQHLQIDSLHRTIRGLRSYIKAKR